ncbi:MAG TPA: hypothetical protein VHC22_31145 [Pirellulales bacterium]|nr:hypothetical protein [Pirellulales bacterium]
MHFVGFLHGIATAGSTFSTIELKVRAGKSMQKMQVQALASEVGQKRLNCGLFMNPDFRQRDRIAHPEVL